MLDSMIWLRKKKRIQKEINGDFFAMVKAEATIARMNRIERSVVKGVNSPVEMLGSCMMQSLDGIGYRRSEI